MALWYKAHSNLVGCMQCEIGCLSPLQGRIERRTEKGSQPHGQGREGMVLQATATATAFEPHLPPPPVV